MDETGNFSPEDADRDIERQPKDDENPEEKAVSDNELGHSEWTVEVSELESQLELPQQYEKMVGALEQSGMIETLSTGELGITAIDGKEYNLPSYDKIAKELSQRPELKIKIDQGFKKLLVVPFGRSLDQLIYQYRETIERHRHDLKATNGDKLTRDVLGSFHKWDDYTENDIKGEIVYGPSTFRSKDNGGQTKTELLKTGRAFRVLLVEDLPDLPARSTGQTVGGRPQLEAGEAPQQLLNKILTDPIYQGEVGLIPEDWLVLATTELESRQLVIDDMLGQGQNANLLGAYLPPYGTVPYAG